MIIRAKESHKEQITELWNNAFGDKKENVRKYLDTLLEYFLVYEEDGMVNGMLSVLPVTLNDKKGGYIYAVVTRPENRGQGICKKLMENVKSDKSYDFLVLVPQNKSLFDFYEKMDFTAVAQLKKEGISSFDKAEYSIRIITAKDYETKRNEYYKNQNFIKWDEKMLEFAESMYCGKFCEILKDEIAVGIAFLYEENKTVFIKELLLENHREVACRIGSARKAEKVIFAYECKDAEPTFMVYPRSFSNTKFGIFLD